MNTFASKMGLALVTLSSLTVAAPFAHAEDSKIQTVRVTGEVATVAGDDAQTEKNAKRDARRKAVEQGAGVLVSSNTIVRNFQLITDEIATSAKGVLTDEQWGPLRKEGNVAKIQLDAKVSKEAIVDSICTVLKANHDPKVTLVFVEKVGDEGQKWTAERGYVEAMFTSAFKDNCFTIVESGVKVTEVSANGDLPQDVINDVVKNSNAQYVLLGQGKLIKSDKTNSPIEGTKMNSYAISANVKLINTATNEVEAVSTKSEQVMGISPENALKAASKTKGRVVVDEVMDDLMKKISARWTDDIMNSGKVQVVVKGVANYAAAKSFKDLVEKQFKGAKVTQRNISGGQGHFDLLIDGGEDALASGIEGKKAGKYTVEVVEVNRGKVVLKLN